MSLKTSALAIVFLGLAASAGLITYLFRTTTLDNPELGLIYYKYRCGRAYEVQADTNRDGSIDYRARFDGDARDFGIHESPIEYWEDRNYDGIYEVHVVFEGSEIQRVELDGNADGEYEEILTGAAARDFYSSFESGENGR